MSSAITPCTSGTLRIILRRAYYCWALFDPKRAAGAWRDCARHRGWDEKTQRLVVTGLESRIYLLKLDQATGALSLDKDFHDASGKPGFDMADRDWPHGWKGSGLPHGVVFSR